MALRQHAALIAVIQTSADPSDRSLWDLMDRPDGIEDVLGLLRSVRRNAIGSQTATELGTAATPLLAFVQALQVLDPIGGAPQTYLSTSNAVRLLEALIHAVLKISLDQTIAWQPLVVPSYVTTQPLLSFVVELLVGCHLLALVIKRQTAVPHSTALCLLELEKTALDHLISGICKHGTVGLSACYMSVTLDHVMVRSVGSFFRDFDPSIKRAHIAKKEAAALLGLVVLTTQWAITPRAGQANLVFDVAQMFVGRSGMDYLQVAIVRLRTLAPALFARLGGFIADGLRAAVAHTDAAKVMVVRKTLAISGMALDQVTWDEDATQAVTSALLAVSLTSGKATETAATLRLARATELLGPVTAVVRFILQDFAAAPDDDLRESAAPLRLLHFAFTSFDDNLALIDSNAIELYAVACVSPFWSSAWSFGLANNMWRSRDAAVRIYALLPALCRRFDQLGLTVAEQPAKDWHSLAIAILRMPWPQDGGKKRCAWIDCSSTGTEKLLACPRCSTTYCSKVCQTCVGLVDPRLTLDSAAWKSHHKKACPIVALLRS